MTLHLHGEPEARRPLPPGVAIHRDHWSDVYRGTAAALIAADLVREDQLPGQPGNGRSMMTYWPDGTRKRQGQGGARAGCRQVQRIAGGRFQVRVYLLDERIDVSAMQHETATANVAKVNGENLADEAPPSPACGLPAHEQAVVDAALAILARRVRQPGAVLNAPRAAREYLRLHLAQSERERFGVFFLDAQHAMIGFEVLFDGTLTETSVYPREVLKRALQLNAAAVILAHNHPSGSAEPSAADELMTQQLATALHYIGVPVLDHLVVGWPNVVSFAERGLIGTSSRYRLSNARAAKADKHTISRKTTASRLS